MYSVHANRSKTRQSDTTAFHKEYHFIQNHGRSKLDLLYTSRVIFYLEQRCVRLARLTFNLQGNIAFYNSSLVVITGMHVTGSFVKLNMKI